MIVHAYQLLVEFPGVSSLKEKRRLLRGPLERARLKFSLSIAEVGMQDSLRSCLVGIASVSSSAAVARKQLEMALEFLEQQEGWEIVSIEKDRIRM